MWSTQFNYTINTWITSKTESNLLVYPAPTRPFAHLGTSSTPSPPLLHPWHGEHYNKCPSSSIKFSAFSLMFIFERVAAIPHRGLGQGRRGVGAWRQRGATSHCSAHWINLLVIVRWRALCRHLVVTPTEQIGSESEREIRSGRVEDWMRKNWGQGKGTGTVTRLLGESPQVCRLFQLTGLCPALLCSPPYHAPLCPPLPSVIFCPCLILFVHYHFTWLREKTPRCAALQAASRCHVRCHISPTIKKKRKKKE